MRTIDPEKYAAQRQAILQAARICFARAGFHKTSTEAICAEAGTSSGKLFHYFPNKKAIILAVVDEQSRQTADYVASLMQRPDLPSALFELLDVVLHHARDGQERRLILEIAAEASRDAEIGALSVEADRRLKNDIEALLVAAIARGQLDTVVPAAHAAQFLMIVIDGIFSRAAADQAFDPLAERAALQTVLGIALRPSGKRHDA